MVVSLLLGVALLTWNAIEYSMLIDDGKDRDQDGAYHAMMHERIWDETNDEHQ